MKKNKLAHLVLLFLSFFVFLGTVFASAKTVSAKELSQAITKVTVLDVVNGRVASPDSSGTYNMVQGVPYRYGLDFDLNAYNGKMVDGDYFTFTLPEPITVKASSFTVTDKDTGVQVADVLVVSNGEGKGGRATFTLKNLEAYRRAKKADIVQDVRGEFFVEFQVNETTTDQTISFPTDETINPVHHVYTVKPRGDSDYSSIVGAENFAKNGGVLQEKPWSSPILGKSGDYLHPWYIRINTNQKAYSTIVIKDEVTEESAPMQFIPESFVLRAGYYDPINFTLKDQEKLVYGVDYTVAFDATYSSFVLTIPNADSRTKNGLPASYHLAYDTTSPADGSQVQNRATMVADGNPLKPNNTRNATQVSQTRSSKVTSGGRIQLETGYRVTVYKIDADTGARLPGAKFKFTPPAGATTPATVVETNNDGIAQSPIYTEAEIKLGQFTVEEVEAPVGYKKSSQSFEVKLPAEGIVRTVKNTPYSVDVALAASKVLHHRVLEAGEFSFVLKDQDDQVLSTVTNTADGSITFPAITLKKAGTYTYTLSEVAGTNSTITYDPTVITATVEVTADAKGELTSQVSYSTGEPIFTNTYTPSPVAAIIEAKKELTGRGLQDGEFSFELKDSQGTVLETATNDATGAIRFSELTFDQVGSFEYSITEVKGNDATVTYDTSVVKVTVEVTDNAGQLEATVAYDNEDNTFENSYTPPSSSSTEPSSSSTEPSSSSTEPSSSSTEPSSSSTEPSSSSTEPSSSSTAPSSSSTEPSSSSTEPSSSSTAPSSSSTAPSSSGPRSVPEPSSSSAAPSSSVPVLPSSDQPTPPSGQKKVLPSTGEETTLALVLLGFVGLLGALIFRKKQA